jgi:hypothetical protein
LGSYRSISTVSLNVKRPGKLYCKRNYTKKRKEIGGKGNKENTESARTLIVL